MTGHRLDVRDLSVAYGRKPVIAGLSLGHIAGGTLTALVGPNGSGKSTLLRAIAGLVPATGAIALDDFDLQALTLPARANRIAYLPQHAMAGCPLLVLEATVAALRVATRAPAGEVERHAASALARLGIAALALEPLDRLSGGQRQLAALAQIIARRTPVVLLDEPTAALDLRSQLEVMAIVRSLAEGGAAVLVVLHDLELAARWADRVVVLQHGRLHSDGAPEATVTPSMLAAVYGVEAQVERSTQGALRVVTNRALADPSIQAKMPGP